MEIRLVQTQKELDAIYKFRYEIYVSEMGRKPENVCYEKAIIKEPLDQKANIFAAIKEGRVLGTVRTNYTKFMDRRQFSSNYIHDLNYYIDMYDISYFNEFFPEKTSFSTKMMVSTNLRSGVIAARLSVATFNQASIDGIRYDFIDCNPPLIKMYEKMGYRATPKGWFIHPQYGDVLSMFLDLEDFEYFKSIGSIFRRDPKKRKDRRKENILNIPYPFKNKREGERRHVFNPNMDWRQFAQN